MRSRSNSGGVPERDLHYAARIKKTAPINSKYSTKAIVVFVAALVGFVTHVKEPGILSAERFVIFARLPKEVGVDQEGIIHYQLVFPIDEMVDSNGAQKFLDPVPFLVRRTLPDECQLHESVPRTNPQIAAGCSRHCWEEIEVEICSRRRCLPRMKNRVPIFGIRLSNHSKERKAALHGDWCEIEELYRSNLWFGIAGQGVCGQRHFVTVSDFLGPGNGFLLSRQYEAEISPVE